MDSAILYVVQRNVKPKRPSTNLPSSTCVAHPTPSKALQK